MPFITARITTDYFCIFCNDCGEQTQNKYLNTSLGGGMPRFEATCKKCNSTSVWKFDSSYWEGLPRKKQEGN
jgi:hypothetical protein